MNIPNIVLIALVFNGLDIITGVVAAIKERCIKSEKLRSGMFKKVGFIIAYFLTWLVDAYGSEVGFNLSIKVLPVLVFYAVTTEVISIIENLHKLNPLIIPHKAIKFFNISQQQRNDIHTTLIKSQANLEEETDQANAGQPETGSSKKR